MSVTRIQVLSALQHRYVKQKGSDPTTTTDELVAFLRQMSADQWGHNTLILGLIADANPTWIISNDDKSVIHAVDDCCKLIFKFIDVEPEILLQLKHMMLVLTCDLIRKPDLPLALPKHSLFNLLDSLVSACVGWDTDLGRAGDQFYKQIEQMVGEIRNDECDYKALNAGFSAFLEKESKRIDKLEERLIASETGIVRSKTGKAMAAKMINDAMTDKQLTQPIIDFLQGPWNNSIQLLALSAGIGGDEWSRAAKLTETIVWTYQPIDPESTDEVEAEKQRLYRIIENLPSEIKEMLVSLAHDNQAISSALEDIEDEHVQVITGQPLEYTEFSPLPLDIDVFEQKAQVSRFLLRKVNELEPGQWFTFEKDKLELRIKLVLKLDDVKQLLFTNRNGMKALEKSFDEFAYYLSTHVIKPLTHNRIFSSTFSTYYQGLTDEFERKQRIIAEAQANAAEAEAVETAAKKQALAEEGRLADEKREQHNRNKQQARASLLKRASEDASKEENKDKLEEFTKIVATLNIGAWLKLPGADGKLDECKLAVKLASTDKMIFVTRSGVKIGEYSSQELIELLVSGTGEIHDQGVEFEDTLAQVVSKLRQDRNKSYDDLTGS